MLRLITAILFYHSSLTFPSATVVGKTESVPIHFELFQEWADILRTCLLIDGKLHGIRTNNVVDYYGRITRAIPIEELGVSSTNGFHFNCSFPTRQTKRFQCFDFVICNLSRVMALIWNWKIIKFFIAWEEVGWICSFCLLWFALGVQY